LPQKTTSAKLSQPFGIANIGLASRDLFDMAGIHNATLNSGLLKSGIYCLPEDACAFHNRQLNLFTLKPSGQFFELAMMCFGGPGRSLALDLNAAPYQFSF
jgi:hypothetical protein